MNVIQAHKYRRIGSLPGCLALNAVDVGESINAEGETVYTTWGRNLTPTDILWVEQRTTFDIIQFSEGAFEIVLPNGTASELLKIVTAKADRVWLEPIGVFPRVR